MRESTMAAGECLRPMDVRIVFTCKTLRTPDAQIGKLCWAADPPPQTVGPRRAVCTPVFRGRYLLHLPGVRQPRRQCQCPQPDRFVLPVRGVRAPLARRSEAP